MKKNTHDMYWWIIEHPQLNVNNMGDPKIEITPHMVCPDTNRVENYEFMNTQLEYWIEVSTVSYDDYTKQYCSHHIWDLDCGGRTLESAIESLYNKVLEKYGDYAVPEYPPFKIENLTEYEAGIVNEPQLDERAYKWYDGSSEEHINYENEEIEGTISVLKKYLQKKYTDKEFLNRELQILLRTLEANKKSIKEKAFYK